MGEPPEHALRWRLEELAQRYAAETHAEESEDNGDDADLVACDLDDAYAHLAWVEESAGAEECAGGDGDDGGEPVDELRLLALVHVFEVEDAVGGE
jgi:hypothetical protein